MFRFSFSLFFFTVLFCAEAFSQPLNLPLNNLNLSPVYRAVNKRNSAVHTSFKPLMLNQVESEINIDSLQAAQTKETKFSKKWFGRKLLNEHFIAVHDKEFELGIDPLFNFEAGRELSPASNLLKNYRGVQVIGNIGKKIAFYSSFYECQASFQSYINSYIEKYKVVPGAISVKDFKDKSFDWGTASGYISYSPAKFLNVQFGHDKHFIGEGYRSLLLSDFAFQYPFLRTTLNFKRINYTWMIASLQNPNFNNILETDIPNTWHSGFQKKTAGFSMLDLNIGKRMQLGLFEGVIFDVNPRQKLKPDYFNPLIFSHFAQYGLNTKNNVLLGMNLKLKLTDHLHLYGQAVLDDIQLDIVFKEKGQQKNKNGFQVGLKGYDLFTKNLNARIELNQVRPYTYSQINSTQSYTHYNQPLAHPLGANFREMLGIVDYKFKRFFTEMHVSYVRTGTDTGLTCWGQNIFVSDYNAQQGYDSHGNYLLQGVSTTITYADFKICYLLNPKTNMNIVIGAIQRNLKQDGINKQSRFIYFGFRTSLENWVQDF